MRATDARLVLVLGERSVDDDGTVTWAPSVQRYETLVTADDVMKPGGVKELHEQLDRLLGYARKNEERMQTLKRDMRRPQ